MSSNLLLMVGACAAALLGLAFLVESEVYIYPRLGTWWWLFTLIAIVAVLFVMRMAFAIWNVREAVASTTPGELRLSAAKALGTGLIEAFLGLVGLILVLFLLA